MRWTPKDELEVDRLIRRLRLRHWLLITPIDMCLIGLEFIWLVPILTFEFCRFIRAPSYEGVCWLGVAGIVSWLILNVTMLKRADAQINGMALSLSRVEQFEIERYSLEDVAGQALPGFRLQMASSRVWFLHVVPSQPGTFYPLAAYNMPMIGTVVFIPFKLDELTLLQKFWILHEIGHGEYQNVAQLTRNHIARCMLLLLVVWIAFSLNYDAMTLSQLGLGTMAIVGVVLYKRKFDMKSEMRYVDAEVLADNYALIAISVLGSSDQSEIERIEKWFTELRRLMSKDEELVLPRDYNVSAVGHARRLKSFRKNLENSGAGYSSSSVAMVAHPLLVMSYVCLLFVAASLPAAPVLTVQAILGAALIVAILSWELAVLRFRVANNFHALQAGVSQGQIPWHRFVGPFVRGASGSRRPTADDPA